MKKNNIDISRETISSVISQFALSAFAFVTLIILSRQLGPSDFGLYAVLLATGAVIQSLVDGFGEGIKKRASEYKTNTQQLYSIGLLSLATFVLVSIPILITIASQTTLITVENSIAIAAFVIGSGLFTIITSFNSGLGYPALSYKYRIVRNGLIFFTQVPLAYLGASVNELLIVCGLSWGLASLGLIIKHNQPITKPTLHTIKSVLSFARWSIPNRLLFTMNERIPYFILGILATSTLIGYYEVAWKLLIPALLIPYTIENTLSVHISHKTEQGTSAKSDLKTALSAASMFAFPICIGSFLLGDELIRLVYSTEYLPAGELLPIFSILVILQGFIYIHQSALRGQDNPRAVTTTSAGRVLGKLLAIPIGFHYGGLLGLVIGITIIDALIFTTYSAINRTYPDPIIISIQLISATVMGIIVYALTTVIHPTALTTILLITIGGIIYTLTAISGLKTVRPEMYTHLRSKIF